MIQKSEGDKIFTEYLRENGIIMRDSVIDLGIYEPLRNTADFQLYLLRRAFRRLRNTFKQNFISMFGWAHRK